MVLAVPIAWLQLWREKLRLLVALFGVAFAVILIFMQLGFQEAMFGSAVRYHRTFVYDIAMISPKMDWIVQPESFPRRRLVQALGVPGVAAVAPVLFSPVRWRNPEAPEEARNLHLVGFNPSDRVFDLPAVASQTRKLQMPDVLLYDEYSRPEFGPIGDLFRASNGEGVTTEVGDRNVRVAGIFRMGTSFGIDANAITSDLNFRRMLPQHHVSRVELGLIQLEPGQDPDAVRDAIAAALPRDVEVLTRADYIERELAFWNKNTPIGYVFEYATLKAMGYTNRFLFGVVMQEGVILAVLGFIPGTALTLFLYRTAGEATRLPLMMTTERGLLVFGLTVLMCCVSAAIALRKVRSVDPAEIF
jgi:putative ABC transport system permease protein